MQHGIERAAADEALSRFSDSTDENLAGLLGTKYARFLTDRNDLRAIEKVRCSLVRCGYSFADVKRAIDEYFDMEEQ